MVTATRIYPALFAGLFLANPAATTIYMVGNTGDCSHAQLPAALAAAAADSSTGPHEIRLAVSELVANNLALANPVRDIEITGGYQRCSHGYALGTSSTVLQVNVANARVMQLHNDIENARRSVTLRRVVMRGGNLATAEGGVNDLYGRSQLKDTPRVPDRFGYTDLGAVEQPDILKYNGFGNRPGN